MQWIKSILASLVEYGKHLKRSICYPFKAAQVSKEITGSYDAAAVMYAVFRLAIWTMLIVFLAMGVKVGIILSALLAADFIHLLVMAEISYHFKNGLGEFAKGYKQAWEQRNGNAAV